MQSLNDSKRYKSIKSIRSHGQSRPQPPPEDEKKPVLTRTSSEMSASRFHEATMRDSPSAEPPSLFMRIMPRSKRDQMLVDPSGEHLMEEYEEEQKSRPALMQTARSASHATQLSGLTHHPNTSISSSTTGTTGGESAQSRDSGIFKLGKSFKEAWHKVTSKSKDVKGMGSAQDDELVQRQMRAEMEYASLKKKGKLGTLGTRAQSTTYRSRTAGYTSPVPKEAAPRDSGIDMGTDIRPSLDVRRSLDLRRLSSQAAPAPVIAQRVSSTPGKKNGAIFHFRTPSLQDIKRITSHSSLHRRTFSATLPTDTNEILVTSTITSTFGEETAGERPSTSAGISSGARSSRSRVDLKKEEKLARKVSELENKLNAARQELEKTRSVELLSATVPEESRPKSRARQTRFQPLPTLPSESLLMADHDEPLSPPPAGLKVVPELPPVSANEPIPSVATPNKQSDSWSQNATPGTEQPGSAFDSSSDGSPEGIFNAIRRHTRSPAKPEESQGRRTPRRLRPKVVDRAMISAPILTTEMELLIPEAVRRSSLDTVSEEASFVSFTRQKPLKTHQPTSPLCITSSPDDSPSTTTTKTKQHKRPATATPTSHHRHARSLSPTKSKYQLPPTTALPGIASPSANQFQHYRSRSMVPMPPPGINFSRPVATQSGSGSSSSSSSSSGGGGGVTKHIKMRSLPRLPPSTETWDWPEDIF
jgi:hypothetical protein